MAKQSYKLLDNTTSASTKYGQEHCCTTLLCHVAFGGWKWHFQKGVCLGCEFNAALTTRNHLYQARLNIEPEITQIEMQIQQSEFEGEEKISIGPELVGGGDMNGWSWNRPHQVKYYFAESPPQKKMQQQPKIVLAWDAQNQLIKLAKLPTYITIIMFF